MKRVLRPVVMFALFALAASSAKAFDQPEYQRHIDWSSQDSGPVEDFLKPLWISDPALNNCLMQGFATGNQSGNRSCAIAVAAEAARNGHANYAMYLVLLTQGHNGEAVDCLRRAGTQAVADYVANNY